MYGKLAYPEFTSEILSVIKSGTIYSLQHMLEDGIPVLPDHAPFMQRLYFRHHDTENVFDGAAGAAAEITMMGQHTGTHIDALCHFSKKIGSDRFFYQDKMVADSEHEKGIDAWGVEQMPPIVQKCILLDVADFYNVEVVEESYIITKEDLIHCAKKQKVQINPGDSIVIRTGFSTYWKEDNHRFLTKHAGVNLEAANYLVDKGVTVVGADTPTFEVLPSPGHEVHTFLLVESGVPIIECLNLEELSRDLIYEFVLIALPLKLKGATASVIHPIAIA